MANRIIIIAHNLRSTHNVGALLRTADGLGVEKVYFCGYTPYPAIKNDPRLPHLASKIDKQISKTALGAEKSVAWEHQEDIFSLIKDLKAGDYQIIGLEQTSSSHKLNDFSPPDKLAIILGQEVEGLEKEVIKVVDCCVEIPMAGQKESFNVVVAAAITLYHCRFYDRISEKVI